MNIIVIEDEKLSAEHLCRLLGRIDNKIQVLAHYDSVKRSINELKRSPACDLLFVDIHLGDGISFEIFSKVKLDIPIIFTTAYDEYAIQAFKLNSIDFLLKPIAEEDLRQALEKFKKWNRNQAQVERERLHKAYESYTQSYKSRFMVKMGENISSIKAEDVLYFVSEEGLVLLVSKENRRYPVDFNLDQLEGMLAPELFFRINRKALVNINNRLKVSVNGLDEEAAVVSRERVSEFKAWLDR